VDMIQVPGDARPIMQMPSEHFRWVSPGYFETIHLPLVSGRLLHTSDEGKNYAIVSELTARTLWQGKDPVGQQFNLAGRTDQKAFHGDWCRGKCADSLAGYPGPDDGVYAGLVSQ
jgi:hypothetical protein